MTEPRFSRILVPTDFSELATGALALADLISSRTNGVIDLLYADPFLPPPHFTSAQVAALADEIRRSKDLAKDELQRYGAEHAPDARTVVVEDFPVPAIVNHARDEQSDLIVMGTHGRRGINRVLLGSVTERVLRESSVPLLTTRSKASALRPVEKILCPVNFTGAAEDALRHAKSLAEMFGATLTVVHVADAKSSEADEMESIDRCVTGTGGAHVDVERAILHGDADEAVLRYVSDNDIDLVVLAATHRQFFDTTVLGSTTVHVIRHSPVPVLTITSR